MNIRVVSPYLAKYITSISFLINMYVVSQIVPFIGEGLALFAVITLVWKAVSNLLTLTSWTVLPAYPYVSNFFNNLHVYLIGVGYPLSFMLGRSIGVRIRTKFSPFVCGFFCLTAYSIVATTSLMTNLTDFIIYAISLLVGKFISLSDFVAGLAADTLWTWLSSLITILVTGSIGGIAAALAFIGFITFFVIFVGRYACSLWLGIHYKLIDIVYSLFDRKANYMSATFTALLISIPFGVIYLLIMTFTISQVISIIIAMITAYAILTYSPAIFLSLFSAGTGTALSIWVQYILDRTFSVGSRIVKSVDAPYGIIITIFAMSILSVISMLVMYTVIKLLIIMGIVLSIISSVAYICVKGMPRRGKQVIYSFMTMTGVLIALSIGVFFLPDMCMISMDMYTLFHNIKDVTVLCSCTCLQHIKHVSVNVAKNVNLINEVIKLCSVKVPKLHVHELEMFCFNTLCTPCILKP